MIETSPWFINSYKGPAPLIRRLCLIYKNMPSKPKDKSTVSLKLTDSQNLLHAPRRRLRFLKGVYAMYTLALMPAILSLLLTEYWDDYGKFMYEYPVFFWIGTLGALATSFSLALSKILARKKPLNYILYAVFAICLMLMFSGFADRPFKYEFRMILLTQAAFNGLALFLYSLIANKGFVTIEAIFFVLGFLLLPSVCLKFAFGDEDCDIPIILFGLIVLFFSSIIMFASEFMCENKNFTMLPDDYIMGAMRLMLIVPLFEDFMEFEPMNVTHK